MGNEINTKYIADIQKIADDKYGITKDGKVTADEKDAIKFFEDKVLEDYSVGDVDHETFNKAMGLYKTNPIATTEATPALQITPASEVATAGKEEKAADKKTVDNKKLTALRNEVEVNVKNWADNGGTIEGLTESLKQRFAIADYQDVLADVEEIVNLVSAVKVESKKDVNNIKKTVTKNYKAKTLFHTDILNAVIDMAENKQVNKEAQTLINIYEGLKSKQTNYNASELKREVKKYANKAGSYYNNKAFDKLVDYIKADALEKTQKRIADSDGQTGYQVWKDAKEGIEFTDDISKEMFHKTEKERKIVKRRNKIETRKKELETYSEKQLVDVLGEDLFRKLISPEASVLHNSKNEDGTYNFSELSDKIIYRVGKDFVLNQSDNYNESEKAGVISELTDILGLSNGELDWAEAKKILTLCKVPRERNSRDAAAIGAGAGIGALSSALSAFLADDVALAYQQVKFSLDAGNAAKLASELTLKGYEFTTSPADSGDVFIEIVNAAFKDKEILDILKGAGIGVLTGAVTGLIFGKSNKFEESHISVEDFDFSNPKYTDITEYEEHVRNRYPLAKANAIIELAKTMKDEKGNFDPRQFDAALKHIGGVGSNINKDEWLGHKLSKLRDMEPTKSEQRLLTTAPTKIEASVIEPKNIENAQRIRVKGSETYVRTYKDTWRFIAETYYPDASKKYGWTKVVAELKKAWEIDRKDTDLPQEKPWLDKILGFDKANPDDATIQKNRALYAWELQATERIITSKKVPGGYVATNVNTGKTHFAKTKEEAINAVKENGYDRTDIYDETGKRIGE